MNGRVYAPGIGRMLSPDPVTQSPENGQNYNRYTYADNNPLKYHDPSGFQLEEVVVRAKRVELPESDGMGAGDSFTAGGRSSGGGGQSSSSPRTKAGDKADTNGDVVTRCEVQSPSTCELTSDGLIVTAPTVSPVDVVIINLTAFSSSDAESVEGILEGIDPYKPLAGAKAVSTVLTGAIKLGDKLTKADNPHPSAGQDRDELEEAYYSDIEKAKEECGRCHRQ